MTAPTVTTPSAAPSPTDLTQAFATLTVAFAADPVVRWFLPDLADHLLHYPALLDLTVTGVTPAGTVDASPDGSGAAIWHAPGATTDDEALGTLFADVVHADRQPDAFAFLEAMAIHHPDEPVWYLPFVGVDPTCQGRGTGSRLLRIGLERCDRDGVPAYLEASTPRNRALYERHGFETAACIQVGDSPPLWPMVRPAGTDPTWKVDR
ncbi:GNAT family N-acetyltransferase [Nitriliruptor alkaliphilus]|uniref:GNAT family N-acetyltransferase n=1 Tax=Nitriliruptor alkaliphilus TaxID=427918 RepID=UPI000695BA87|nr:GNAT family N-acetyltransferase [Nitriliruptor alkaliphilus]